MSHLLGVRLDEELHMEFKLLCVRRRVTMSEVVAELIREWVEAQQGLVSNNAKEAGDDRVQ